MKYAIDLITEVQTRLPENLDTLLMLKHFHPSTAMFPSKESISSVAARHRNVIKDMDDFENEWTSLSLEKWPQSCRNNTTSFWANVYEKKNFAGEQVYPNVSSLALALLSLPFSNASVERIFSKMNIVHSKVRNRFHIRSVEAVLQISYGLKLENKTCVTFRPSDDMLRNFSAKDDSWTDVDLREDDWLVPDM